jgi:hypothetical protein
MSDERVRESLVVGSHGKRRKEPSSHQCENRTHLGERLLGM